jgi:hypothetical protein
MVINMGEEEGIMGVVMGLEWVVTAACHSMILMVEEAIINWP